MKQIIQDLKKGGTHVIDVPRPNCGAGSLLIASQRSLVSAGTERMLVDFGRGGYLAKAKSQPEKVRQVLDKVRTDGLLTTAEAVLNKLDQPMPLGYCNAGQVLEVGRDVTGFEVGDRVASNGPHAELVCVPCNLCAKIPDEVGDDAAAFTILASVAMQGVRLAQPTLGESVVVMGLGLVGLMTVQILRANGCQVLGVDFNAQRLALARHYGAATVDLGNSQDPVETAMSWSRGRGVDAVLITTATKDDGPLHQAAQMSRQRGRIVLVGVAGLNLQRADFYEKELSFQVSCSYGPGRYDESYEQSGNDYPIGFVRWTEQRNFEAVLRLMAEGQLDVSALITHHFPQTDGAAAYHLLTSGQPSLGILLTYPEGEQEVDTERTVTLSPSKTVGKTQRRSNGSGHDPTVAVIGAGAFTTGVLLPALKKTRAHLHTVASAGGTSAAIAARRFGFQQASTDVAEVFENPEIDLVLITTRHNNHAQLAIEAMDAGKHVFVEKPAAIDRDQLLALKQAVLNNSALQFVVGFNRRFAPLVVDLKKVLDRRAQPVCAIYTINAGEIPADHWIQDPQAGGGRIIGEACHFIDLLRHLIDRPIIGLHATMIGDTGQAAVREDKMTINLIFEDGSTGTVHYLANGSKRYPKERIEIFGGGKVVVLNNFTRLKGYGYQNLKNHSCFRQDKGHLAEMTALLDRVASGGPPLIPWNEIEEVTLASLSAVERARQPLLPLNPVE